MGFAQWWDDRRWAANMVQVRRFRRSLIFSRRAAFDRALQHRLDSGSVVAYPDAIYCLTVDDLCRALLGEVDYSARRLQELRVGLK